MTDTRFFAHPAAIVETDQIGAGSRIWAFCNVQQGARIGADCNICDGCFVEKGVVVGDRVTVKNGVSLWNGVVLEDEVFVGPGVLFTNDVYPRSKVARDRYDATLIRHGATIGAGAVIVAGHTVGRFAFIGAGAVVTRDVPDFGLWLGNPARPAGYVCTCAQRLEFSRSGDKEVARCRVCGREYALRDGQVTAR
ncbi:MAG: acyltransferase [bacterium]